MVQIGCRQDSENPQAFSLRSIDSIDNRSKVDSVIKLTQVLSPKKIPAFIEERDLLKSQIMATINAHEYQSEPDIMELDSSIIATYRQEMTQSTLTLAEREKVNREFQVSRAWITGLQKSNTQLTLNNPDSSYNFELLVKALFHPDNFICSIPDRIKQKLREKGGFIPSEINSFFRNKKPQKANVLVGKGLEYLLHSVQVVGTDNRTKQEFYPIGGSTFDNFEINKFLAPGDNLLYSLDCQGYFNAAMAVGFELGSRRIAADAESNMTRKASLFIGYGSIISPIAQAFYNDIPGIEMMNKERRLDILKRLLNITGIADDDIIKPKTAIWALFFSSQGESSFNGKGDITVSGSLIAFQASASAGGSLTRKSSFSQYQVYYTDDQVFTGRNGFTLSAVKQKIAQLEDLK